MARREGGIERAARLAAHLPGVEVSTWYGTPALKVAGKGFIRLKEPGVMMVTCPLELKQALIEAEPDLFSKRRIIWAGRGCWSGWRRSTTIG